MINRLIYTKIAEMATKFPIIAITGPRQSGKTTLCKTLFSDYTYVNFENLDTLAYANSDPKGFLAQYGKQVIFDEIQNAPDLFSYIQVLVDEDRSTGQYILTGSQNFLLLEKISQSLAGRIFIHHLLPFSYAELKEDFTNLNVNELIYTGGYPRIYDHQINPTDFFPSYIQTYVQRDIRNLLNVQNLNTFNAFLKICAGRTGQLFNASSIANQIGVNYKTINNWLSILEASFIIFRLEPWYKNFNKRIIKSPKIYFYDTGLACHLLGLRKPEDVDIHFMKGALFENFVILEHLKNQWNTNQNFTSYFWRDNKENEIDLLTETGNAVKIAEIKSAKTIRPDFKKGLDYFEKISSGITLEKYVIYGGDERRTQLDIHYIPWNEVDTI